MQNLEAGSLVQSSFDGEWNIESVENDSAYCFRYDDDWEKHEKEFALSDLQRVETNTKEVFKETDFVKLASGGPSWTVVKISESTAICAMPEEFDFMEVEIPLRALKSVQ